MTTITQRLKNIWKLGENKHIPFANIDLLPTDDITKNGINMCYKFEGKPMAKIIKRKPKSDEEIVDDLLKE